MASANEWTVSLGPDGAPEVLPFVGNGKVGLIPTFSSQDGLNTARAVVAYDLSDGKYGQHVDTFHTLKCRFAGAASASDRIECNDRRVHALSASVALDMRRGALTVPFSVTDPRVGAAVANVVSVVRAVQSHPNLVVHTQTIATSSPVPNFVVLHEIAHRGVSAPSYHGSFFSACEVGGAADRVFVVSGSTDTSCVSCAYLFDSPSMSCEGISVRKSDGACVVKVSISNPAASPANYTMHIVSLTIPSPDEDRARQMMLMHLSRWTIPRTLAAHESAWAGNWLVNVDIEPKDGLTAGEYATFERHRRSLRYGMYAVHSCVAPWSVIDLSGAVSANAADVFMSPLLVLMKTDCAKAMFEHRGRAMPVAASVAQANSLKGALYDADYESLGRAIDPVHSGYRQSVRPSTDIRWDSDSTHLRVLGSTFTAINVWDLFRASADTKWLRDAGYDVLKSVADMVCSAVEIDSTGQASGGGAYTLSGTVGIETSINRVSRDQVLSVASSKDALKIAIQASNILGVPCPAAWREVYYGLSIPHIGAGVVGYDRDSAAPAAAPALRMLEPLILFTTPALAAHLGSESAVSGMAYENYAFWTTKKIAEGDATTYSDADARYLRRVYGLDRTIQLHVLSRSMQASAGKVQEFTDALEALLARHLDAWGGLVVEQGAQGVPASRRHADLSMSCALLTAVVKGVCTVSINGSVSENRLYSTSIGVSSGMSANMPALWKRVIVEGVGSRRKAFSVPNRMTNQITVQQGTEPWTVNSLYV